MEAKRPTHWQAKRSFGGYKTKEAQQAATAAYRLKHRKAKTPKAKWEADAAYCPSAGAHLRRAW